MHVVVVGGGIVGASIAWHLAERANVTVVASDVGGVATPNSFAWINAAWGNPKPYFDFRVASMAHWHEVQTRLPDLPIRWAGSLSWDMSEAELQAFIDNHSSWGYDIARVDRGEISRMEPGLADAFLPPAGWGVYCAGEGAVEAHVAAARLVAAARERGAVVHGTTATAIYKEDGVARGVVTAASAVVKADHVVLAAGLGTVPLLAAEGVRLPLAGVAGLLVNSRPTSRRLVESVTYGPRLHVRQTSDGVVRAGSDFAGGAVGVNPQRTAEELFAEVKAAFVDGAELELDYFTIGYRPKPEDDLPILGPVEGLDRVTVAVMHSGVTNAALVGKLLTRQILDGETDPLLKPFGLGRFSNVTALHGEQDVHRCMESLIEAATEQEQKAFWN